MINKLLLGTFALAMMSGAAYADNTTGSTALDNKQMMAPFYTDAEMTTLKSDEEFRAAWMGMTPEDRDMVSKECDTDSEKLHNNFCEKTKELGGAN